MPPDFLAKYIVDNDLSMKYSINNRLPKEDELRMIISYQQLQMSRSKAVNDEYLKEMKVKLKDRMKG